MTTDSGATSAWLIERGQSENHEPTIWWIGDRDATSRDGERWTQDANEATWFNSREEAQAVIDRLFAHPLSARATGHTFLDKPLSAPLKDLTVELEIRQNELYLAMRVVEEMPASEAQTTCISKLAERMRKLVELRGKSEVGRSLDV